MAQNQDWFSQFQTAPDDDFFNQFQVVTPPKPPADFFSRSLEGIRGFGGFLGNALLAGLNPGSGLALAKSHELGQGMAEPFRDVGRGNYGRAAIGLIGANPDAVAEDWETGNYGALLGDFALPAALAGITRGARVMGPSKLAKRLPEVLPAETPLPSGTRMLGPAPERLGLPARGETFSPTRFYEGQAGIADANQIHPFDWAEPQKLNQRGATLLPEEFGQITDIGPMQAAERTSLHVTDPAQLNPAFRALVPERYGPRMEPLGLQGIPKDLPEVNLGFRPGGEVVNPPSLTTETPYSSSIRAKGQTGVYSDFLDGREAGGNKPIQPISRNVSSEQRAVLNEPKTTGQIIRDVWNVTKATMAVDLPYLNSAAFRQALPLIGTGAWFKAWIPSIRAYGSKAFADSHRAMLEADPLMTRKQVPKIGPDGNPIIRKGQVVVEELPSIADQMGVQLLDKESLSAGGETIRSTLAEKIPYWGRVIAASNRSFAAFMDDVRVNTARNFYEAMPNKNNLIEVRALGDAVNTFTGRGRMGTRIPFTRGKSVGLEEYGTAAQIASDVMFSPKLQASRMQMLNPINYASQANKGARIEYLKAALRTAGAWYTFTKLGEMIGGEVNSDPTNTDFGKVRFGDFRLEPSGGFQKFLVLGAKLARGESTSSVSGNTTQLGKGYKSDTKGDVIQRFVSNMLHPNLKYFYDAAYAGQGAPFAVYDRAVQMAIPMITTDLLELAKTEPELVPWLAPFMSSGMGGQYYTGQDFGRSKVIPSEWDILLGEGYTPRIGGNVRFIRP